MANKSRASLVGITVFSFVCIACLVAFAANRKVGITAQSGSLKLVNTSSQTVTYNLTCFDSTGTQLFSSNALTLASKNSETLGSSGTPTCQVGYVVNTDMSFPTIHGCGAGSLYGLTDYSSAAASCGSGYHLCTLSEWASQNAGIGTDGFLDESSLQTTFGLTTDYGATWETETKGTDRPQANWTSDYQVITGPGTDSGTIYQMVTTTTGDNMAICCPDGGGGTLDSCDVEITAGGHLSSPQFKGGAAF
jgi:hypothetical protein